MDEYIDVAAETLLDDKEAIKSLLKHLEELEEIRFDDRGNPYWEACGESVAEGAKMSWDDEDDEEEES